MKFNEGNLVDFDTWADHRYRERRTYYASDRILKCRITRALQLPGKGSGMYDLMELDANPDISAGHYMVPERCLSFTANPHTD